MNIIIKTIMTFIAFSSFIFSQSASVDKGEWLLLGATSDINIPQSFSPDCYIFTYKNDHWERYNPKDQDISKIKTGIGFWMYSRSTCLFDTISKPLDPASKNRFTTLTTNSQITMLDTMNNLEWVNGAPGCKPTLYKSQEKAFIESRAYCESLDYANHKDWKVPLATQAKTFLVDMDKAGLVPYYTSKSCPRLMGLNESKDKIQGVRTHNYPPIGLIHDFPNSNAGIRCVRSR